MSSFIDMMANHIWSDADITRRTEAMIRSEFSAEDELILNRKVIGASMGNYTLTDHEQLEIARYNQVSIEAQAMGALARKDMAALMKVFPLEQAQHRLDRASITAAWNRLQEPGIIPIVDESTEETINAQEVAQDQIERNTAEMLVSPHLIQSENGLILDPEAVAHDDLERHHAQQLIDHADEDTVNLFESRKTHQY